MSDQPPPSRPTPAQRSAPKNEMPNLSCPQHNENYVLRYKQQLKSGLLIYECPMDGCFNTYQERVRR